MPKRSAASADADDADVRSRILREATRLFASRGFAAVPLQEIAHAVGVAKPTIVYHFGTKEALQTAVLGELVGHWREELPRLLALAAAGPADQAAPSGRVEHARASNGPRLDSLLGALLAFFGEDRNRAKLALRAMIDAPDVMRELLHEALQPWTALLGQSIRDAQAAGTVRPEVDPEAYALVAITAAIGILAAGDLTNAMFEPEPSLDAQRRELIRIARTALLSPRP